MNSFAKNNRLRSNTAFLLIAVMLSLWVGGAVAHYCFDGLEPPVTLHFDSLSGHIEHEAEGGHMDVEKEVFSDNVISKLFDLDSILFVTFLFLISLLTRIGSQVIYYEKPAQYHRPHYYQPLLRAPPLVS